MQPVVDVKFYFGSKNVVMAVPPIEVVMSKYCLSKETSIGAKVAVDFARSTAV